MAAASERLDREISAIIECSICQELYTNPKILPCLHTFCFGCLEQYASDKYPGSSEKCPLCRHKFIIPQGGIANLKGNFYVNNLVEIIKLNEQEFGVKKGIEEITIRQLEEELDGKSENEIWLRKAANKAREGKEYLQLLLSQETEEVKKLNVLLDSKINTEKELKEAARKVRMDEERLKVLLRLEHDEVNKLKISVNSKIETEKVLNEAVKKAREGEERLKVALRQVTNEVGLLLHSKIEVEKQLKWTIQEALDGEERLKVSLSQETHQVKHLQMLLDQAEHNLFCEASSKDRLQNCLSESQSQLNVAVEKERETAKRLNKLLSDKTRKVRQLRTVVIITCIIVLIGGIMLLYKI